MIANNSVRFSLIRIVLAYQLHPLQLEYDRSWFIEEAMFLSRI
jgi:hypothetical protein